MDWDREQRVGVPEAVYCAHKSAPQVGAAIAAAREKGKRLLLTHLNEAGFAALESGVRAALDYDPKSRTAIFGAAVPLAASGVGIVAAGTSDMPVALEAQRTLAFGGHTAPVIADVGVAGLWRLLDQIETIRAFKVIIAVAGMEGALFTVLSGMAAAPVIAVPTSVGYGVAQGGTVALHAALASCAPGVTVVNIDNGYGAAAAAIKMLNLRGAA